MDSALLGVIGITVIGGGAMGLALWLWTTRVTMPRVQESLQARLAEPKWYAASQGWQVWEHPDRYPGDRPWSGLIAQQGRGGVNFEAVLVVGGSRLGHDFYGLWMRSYGYDGSEGFETVLGLLLPWACRVELSVRPRRRAPARSRQTGLTAATDTDFEGRFRVQWDPGETGWTAGDLLTPELRAALLSGEAYPRWKLSGRHVSTTTFRWMSGAELDAAVSALAAAAGHLQSSRQTAEARRR